MLATHQEQEVEPSRPLASHGWHKPDRSLVIALIRMQLTELPANSLRRKVLEQMIEGEGD